MKVAFLFDVKLDKYENDYYSINLNKKLWEERYLPYFNDVKVICRKIDVTENPSINMHKTNMEHVEVCALDNQNIVKRIVNLHKENKLIDEYIQDCDVVISRSFWGIRQAKKNGKPYMIEVVSCMWDSLWNHSLSGKIMAIPVTLAMKIAVKKAPFVLYVTEKFLQNRYPSQGVTVGVSDVIIPPITQAIEKSRFEKISNTNFFEKIKIGTAAAVNVEYKGQRFVIEALAILKKKGIKNLEYHMAGGGEQISLKNLAKELGVLDQVVFHGALKHSDVIKFLDDIDIYIQPSLQEGLPRAVVEAMSRGCPCIGAKTGGIPELLVDSMICSRRNMAKDIAVRIEKSLNKEQLTELSNYSFEKAKNYEKEILDKKRKSFMKKFVKYCNEKITR